MDDPRSEDLKNELAKTRSMLADKLETLEEQILEPAAAAVTETVTTVKEAVGNTVESMQSTMSKVTQAFDLAAHVRTHPWQMMGLGVASGFLLSQFVKPGTPAIPLQCPEPLPAVSEAISPPATKPDFQQNRSNGTYSARQAVSDASSADSQVHRRSGEGWSKLATEMQSTLIHALAPVVQGLIGAVLAEFLRPTRASSAEAAISQPRDPIRDRPKRDEGEHRLHEEWPPPDSHREQDWENRLRSTPR